MKPQIPFGNVIYRETLNIENNGDKEKNLYIQITIFEVKNNALSQTRYFAHFFSVFYHNNEKVENHAFFTLENLDEIIVELEEINEDNIHYYTDPSFSNHILIEQICCEQPSFIIYLTQFAYCNIKFTDKNRHIDILKKIKAKMQKRT
jgi:hypothetical protein